MELIEVWIEHPVRSLDRTYTYWYDTPLPCGVRVEVSFNHRQLIGFVEEGCHTDQTLEEVEKEKGFELQKIGNVLDGEPLITPELHDLALWMRDETLSSAIACFQAMLPAKRDLRTVVPARKPLRADSCVTSARTDAWELVPASRPANRMQ